MPVMPSWVDYLPDGAQMRVVVDEANAKAKRHAAELESADPAVLGYGLAAAAAECARTWVIAPSANIKYLYRPHLARAMPLLGPQLGAEAVFGVLAFLNEMLVHGGYVDGHYDGRTRAGLDREIAILEHFAQRRVRSRPLAHVALGSGVLGLARSLSDDPAIGALADACEARRAEPFYDFVAAFPSSEVGSAEVMFVARAFVVSVEGRGRGGIGAAASWLKRAVHEGPTPLSKYEPPPAFPEGPKPRTGPSSRAWTTIELSDVQGLWGGRMIGVSSIGDVEVVVVAPTKHSVRYRSSLSDARLDDLDRVLRENDLRTMEIPMRNGIPDEARPSLTLTAPGAAPVSQGKWANDRHPGFDAIAGWLNGLSYEIEEANKPGRS